MADFQNTIDVLGDTVVAYMLVGRTIESFADDIITAIGNRAFYECSALVSVDIPNATSITQYAFYGCSALASVNIPNVTNIGTDAFDKCNALVSIDMPKVTSLVSTFQNSIALASVNIPNVRSLGNYTFRGCSALTSIDLPKVTSIASSVFQNNSNFGVIILRASQVCTLSNTNAFTSTHFASGGTGGTVFVPQALITEYQNATNWSTLYAAGTCNFVAIEGSEYE
jgi:hypothetical protein